MNLCGSLTSNRQGICFCIVMVGNLGYQLEPGRANNASLDWGIYFIRLISQLFGRFEFIFGNLLENFSLI